MPIQKDPTTGQVFYGLDPKVDPNSRYNPGVPYVAQGGVVITKNPNPAAIRGTETMQHDPITGVRTGYGYSSPQPWMYRPGGLLSPQQ